MVDYNYSLSVDFAGDIAVSALYDEIVDNVIITQDPDSITVLGDVVTISFALALTPTEQSELDNVVAAHAAICKQGLIFSSAFSDVISFGSTANNLQNAFLNNGDNGAPSNQSAPIAESNGQVIYVSVSSDGDSSYWIDIVEGAFNGLAGTYSGGTVIGSVFKPAGQLDASFDLFSSPFPFTQGSRISAYVRKDGGGASKPLVRLFLEYLG